MRDRRTLAAAALAAALPYVVVLAFSGKAIHMDDPIYVWTARHIAAHPLDFYGFEVNWGGTDAPMFEATKYPPAVSYFLAPFGAIFGWSERVLHLSIGIFASLAGVSTYYLARRCCNQPLFATCAAMATPAFVVSATTIMSDIPMLGLYTLAVLLWVAGLDSNRHRVLIAAAASATLALLANYFALTLVPLLCAYTVLASRRADPRCAYLLVPIAGLGLYTACMYRFYGTNPFIEAAAYTLSSTPGELFGYVSGKPFLGLVFTGGCLASAGFAAPLLWSRRVLLAALVAAVGLVVVVARFDEYFFYVRTSGRAEAFRYSVHYVLFLLAGCSLIAIALLDLARRRDAISFLLAAWLLGTFVFASWLNWSVTARSILPMAAPAGILIARRIDFTAVHHAPQRRAIAWVSLVPALVLALWIAYADYSQANAARWTAREVIARAEASPGSVRFLGHWGFQYYLEEGGLEFLTEDAIGDIRRGDRVAIFRNLALPPYSIPAATATALPVETISAITPAYASTLNPVTRSGFYSSVFGSLPYTIGPSPEVAIDLLEYISPPTMAGTP